MGSYGVIFGSGMITSLLAGESIGEDESCVDTGLWRSVDDTFGVHELVANATQVCVTLSMTLLFLGKRVSE